MYLWWWANIFVILTIIVIFLQKIIGARPGLNPRPSD